MRVETLLRRVEALEESGLRRARQIEIPKDRVAFAYTCGVRPDEWQADLLRSEASRVILNVSRQAGKSSMAAILALHQALTVPGSLTLALSPSLRQSQELFGKVAAYYRNLGESVPTESDRKLGLQLANGSRVEALPGSEKTVRGFSAVSLLILDEAARVDDALYHAARPFLAVSGGRMLMMSTPYGKRGIFFKEWTGGGNWQRFEVPATRCPRISAEFLEEERRSLPARVFAQEYLCSFEETEDSVFAHEDIQAALSEEVIPLAI